MKDYILTVLFGDNVVVEVKLTTNELTSFKEAVSDRSMRKEWMYFKECEVHCCTKNSWFNGGLDNDYYNDKPTIKVEFGYRPMDVKYYFSEPIKK